MSKYFQSLKSLFLKKDKANYDAEGNSDGKLTCTPFDAFGSHIPNGILGQIRVVFLSDIHCKQYKVGFGIDITQPNSLTQEEKLKISIENLPDGDILIISGDFVETGLLEELSMFNLFLQGVVKEKTFKHIVFTCGNHERTIDIDFYQSEGWRYHKTKQDVHECRYALFNNLPTNVHYLFDNFIVLEGLKIYGSPWVVGGETVSSETSSAHFRWAYSVTEDELVTKFAQIPDDVDILVTHMPPYGIGDGRRNYDKDYFDEEDRQIFGYDHEGSISLRDRLLALQRPPILHCYGHIHSGYGAYRPTPVMNTEGTLFVNAANCDEDYLPIQPALVVDISATSSLQLALSSDVLVIAQRAIKLKLDTAIAVLVAIDSYCGRGRARSTVTEVEDDFLATSPLKTAGYVYLLQVLTAACSTGSYSAFVTNTAKEKKEKVKNATAIADEIRVQETRLTQLFTQHSLLQAMFAARRFSRGAVEESAEDFRAMQLVIPHLYIGSIYPSECKKSLDSAGITHIVNCCHGWAPSFPDDFVYLNVPVEDEDTQNLSEYFIDCIAFIDVAINQDTSDVTSDHENNNNVYVHCQLGLSRSGAIVIAYLMFTLRISYVAATALLKRARPFICPNSGFVKQLQSFETSLRL